MKYEISSNSKFSSPVRNNENAPSETLNLGITHTGSRYNDLCQTFNHAGMSSEPLAGGCGGLLMIIVAWLPLPWRSPPFPPLYEPGSLQATGAEGGARSHLSFYCSLHVTTAQSLHLCTCAKVHGFPLTLLLDAFSYFGGTCTKEAHHHAGSSWAMHVVKPRGAHANLRVRSRGDGVSSRPINYRRTSL